MRSLKARADRPGDQGVHETRRFPLSSPFFFVGWLGFRGANDQNGGFHVPAVCVFLNRPSFLLFPPFGPFSVAPKGQPFVSGSFGQLSVFFRQCLIVGLDWCGGLNPLFLRVIACAVWTHSRDVPCSIAGAQLFTYQLLPRLHRGLIIMWPCVLSGNPF